MQRKSSTASAYEVWGRGLSAISSKQHINNTFLAKELAKYGYISGKRKVAFVLKQRL